MAFFSTSLSMFCRTTTVFTQSPYDRGGHPGDAGTSPPTDTETEAVRKPLVVTEFGFTPAPEPT